MLRPGAPADYPEQVILAVLRALGVAEAEAVALATAPLPQTHAPQGVIFERIGANPQPSDDARHDGSASESLKWGSHYCLRSGRGMMHCSERHPDRHE